jgi:hypothetical protein
LIQGVDSRESTFYSIPYGTKCWKKWNLLNVYGSAQEDHKKEFLRELATFCDKSKELYVAGGDFNILRFSYEKNKNFQPSRITDILNVIINANGLRETHCSGGCYTWSNGQADPTLEKPDRVLMSKDWENLFPIVHILKKPRDMSDHNPLILNTLQPSRSHSRAFRFELSWLTHPDFKPKVQKLWQDPTRDIVALDRVLFKLKKI